MGNGKKAKWSIVELHGKSAEEAAALEDYQRMQAAQYLQTDDATDDYNRMQQANKTLGEIKPKPNKVGWFGKGNKNGQS